VLAASHVFLLEPSVSVAVEQQALARVHRFGQTRPVRITRFISQHTVEVCALAASQPGFRYSKSLILQE
jgi:SNF2 family DNA or RNA helicase